MAKLILPFLFFSVLQSFSQTLIWGIPEKTAIAFGGVYDTSSGLTKWKGGLTLTRKESHHIAGTFVVGSKKYVFNSQAAKLDATQSVILRFSLQTTDNQFSITASKINSSQIEIRIGPVANQAVYVFNFLRKTEPTLIRGSAVAIEKMIHSEEMLMLPLLSYTLGSEGRLTGNVYPAAIPIHRIALAIAQQKDIEMLTINKDSLVRLSISLPGSGSGVSCAGRMPGTTAQECYGQCGPFWGGRCICWDWACGDCCCHQACKEHDLACKCNNYGLCYAFGFTPLLCGAPCNNPGTMPGCGCPSGQFYCSYTSSCLATGAQCRPSCGPTEVYCERLRRCVKKGQCQPVSCSTLSCGEGQICWEGQCFYY